MRTKRTWPLLLLPPLVLLLLLCGCHRARPVTTPSVVQAPAPTAPPPEVAVHPAPAVPAPTPPPEDPLLSSDLQVVNRELARLGFTSTVYFPYDESTLSDEAQSRLAGDSGLLKSHRRLELTLEGYCDERGTPEYNLALGDRRAASAKSYLASLGVDPSHLQTISYGLEHPVCSEHEESCWTQNRRVHLVVTGHAAAAH